MRVYVLVSEYAPPTGWLQCCAVIADSAKQKMNLSLTVLTDAPNFKRWGLKKKVRAFICITWSLFRKLS